MTHHSPISALRAVCAQTPPAPSGILELARATPELEREIIFETVYGSKLYGCEQDGSDHDIRGVHMPSLEDFLLETKQKPRSLEPLGDAMDSDDIQYFPVGVFIAQLHGMKVNSVEIFFAALAAQRRGAEMNPAMELILSHRERLINANPAGFIGHARQRASAYVAGDDRNDRTLMANRHVLACLEEVAQGGDFDAALRLMDVDGLIDRLVQDDLVRTDVSKNGDPVLIVNSKQFQMTMRIGEAMMVTRQRIERFSKKAADVSPKVINKDLYTALRMMEGAQELMESGEIAFPCRNAAFYRRVRAGEIPKQEVLARIDAAQADAVSRAASGNTPLPAPEPMDAQKAFRDELVAELRWMALNRLLA